MTGLLKVGESNGRRDQHYNVVLRRSQRSGLTANSVILVQDYTNQTAVRQKI